MVFGQNSPKCSQFCLTFDQRWYTRWCIRYATGFIGVLRNSRNLAKNWFFDQFWKNFFVYALLHPMSYISSFYQMKDLIKIYMVSFISAEFVVVKLKVFKFFLINSASMKWPLLGFFGTLVQRTEAVSNKTTQCFTSITKRQLLKMYHLRHRLRIFLFCRKVMFRSQDIQIFVFSTILWFTKSVTSWWKLLNGKKRIFEDIFWTTTH